MTDAVGAKIYLCVHTWMRRSVNILCDILFLKRHLKCSCRILSLNVKVLKGVNTTRMYIRFLSKTDALFLPPHFKDVKWYQSLFSNHDRVLGFDHPYR